MTKEFAPETMIPPPVGREASVDGVVEEHGCQKADELWLFDSWRVQNSPPSVYSALVSSASRKVWVWDRYLNDDDIDVFRAIRSGVSFRLLFEGSCHSETHRRRVQDFVAAFTARFPAVTLQVKCLDRDQYPQADSAFGFHDRYLFVDEEVFSVGSSMTSHRRREWTTAVMKVLGATARKVLHDKFEGYWRHELTKWIRQA